MAGLEISHHVIEDAIIRGLCDQSRVRQIDPRTPHDMEVLSRQVAQNAVVRWQAAILWSTTRPALRTRFEVFVAIGIGSGKIRE